MIIEIRPGSRLERFLFAAVDDLIRQLESQAASSGKAVPAEYAELRERLRPDGRYSERYRLERRRELTADRVRRYRQRQRQGRDRAAGSRVALAA